MMTLWSVCSDRKHERIIHMKRKNKFRKSRKRPDKAPVMLRDNYLDARQGLKRMFTRRTLR